MVDLEKEEWSYCLLCEHVRLRCVTCENVSCSGGGCDVCHDRFSAAIALSNSANQPPWYVALEAPLRLKAMEEWKKVTDTDWAYDRGGN